MGSLRPAPSPDYRLDGSETLGAATITATYVKHGRKWRVLIRPAGGPRVTRVVTTEQDAKDLVRHFNRLGMAGVNLGQAIADARTDRVHIYPPIRGGPSRVHGRAGRSEEPSRVHRARRL